MSSVFEQNVQSVFEKISRYRSAIENDKTLKYFAKHRHVRLWASMSRR